MKEGKMNLPNKLSIFRIILVIVLVIIPYINGLDILVFDLIPLSNLLLALVFLIGALTDMVDGEIARKQHLITDLGKFLDPLADKILVLSALVILVELGKVPSWIPIVVLTREFAVSGYRLIASSKKGEVIAASIWGKIKTVTQMIAIIFLLIDINPMFAFINSEINIYWRIFNGIGSIIMIISVIATIFSGWDYLKNLKDFIKE